MQNYHHDCYEYLWIAAKVLLCNLIRVTRALLGGC